MDSGSFDDHSKTSPVFGNDGINCSFKRYKWTFVENTMDTY